MNKLDERKFMTAMTKTLNAYEALIKDPKRNFCKWRGYGDSDNCRICKAVDWECENCPLDSCASDSFYQFEQAVREHMYCPSANYEDLVKVAKERYRWLIRKIKSRGYAYE